MDFINGKDFNKMSLEDIKVLVNKVSSQANQQIKELEDTGYYTLSQAYRSLQGRQGKDNPSFSTNLEGLTKPQLYGRYVSAVNFMSLKTSNVEGTKETNIDIYKNMGYTEEQAEKIVENLAKDSTNQYNKNTDNSESTNAYYDVDIRDFWKAYHRMEQIGIDKEYGSDFVMEKLKSYMSITGEREVNIDKFRNFMDEELERESEEINRQYEEENERLWGEDIEDEF